ncbi:MAG: hypothetical protein ABWZ76_02525 [Acidimicrobiales bacterium]
MTWVFVVAGGLLVFAIAAALVGSEAFRLGHETPAAIFDLDEAVDAVADGLPPEAQAGLTYDELRQLILATLDHLRAKGVSALPGEEVVASEEDVVVDDDTALASVLGAVEAEGLDVSDEHAALVIDRLLVHLGDIGALGPRVGEK